MKSQVRVELPGLGKWRLRARGFGLLVVEHSDAFSIPYTPLPAARETAVTEGLFETASVEYITGPELVKRMFVGREPAPAASPSTPAELRLLKEREAIRSEQPFEWASHVYVTVNGEVRWRCCSNLFDEPHSPYCASPGGRA